MPHPRPEPPTTPLPIPTRPRPRGLLLFGGTFDPPHNAHIQLPRSIRDRLLGRGWWLLYVPAARNPLKAAGPQSPDAARVDMLRLATRRIPRCAVWTDELDRAAPRRPSYWIDTLRRARAALDAQGLTDIPLRFLMGSDAAVTFHRWREPREILALADPIVMLRPPHKTPAAVRRALRRDAPGFWTPAELDLWESAIDAHATMPHSATDARAALAEADAATLRGLLPPTVAARLLKPTPRR